MNFRWKFRLFKNVCSNTKEVIFTTKVTIFFLVLYNIAWRPLLEGKISRNFYHRNITYLSKVNRDYFWKIMPGKNWVQIYGISLANNRPKWNRTILCWVVELCIFHPFDLFQQFRDCYIFIYKNNSRMFCTYILMISFQKTQF